MNVIRSVSYDQTAILLNNLWLHVPGGVIDCNSIYFNVA
jgi:hypothetical protein